MKIERINEVQVRCTLDADDIRERDIHISELAYGTDKARELFDDVVKEAWAELHIEADDIPLMIEAVPINAECIVLIITQVEDPEEMDTRFASYAPSVQNATPEPDSVNNDQDDVADLFRRLQQGDFPVLPSASKAASGRGGHGQISALAAARRDHQSDQPFPTPAGGLLLWSFATMRDIIGLAQMAGRELSCPSALFKDQGSGRYYLLLSPEKLSPADNRRLFSLLSEYGNADTSLPKDHAFLSEHLSTVIAHNALANLAGL
ncbi:MAG: adaptor protein MecA [Butyrivibrio sp.]|nr:adaptor protein MecA [Butyrivibrio sp.]